MSFGEKLSAARKSKGFSQEELALKIEVSRQAISKWETNTAQPETSNILKLCKVLEVSPNELFEYEPSRESPHEDKKLIISAKSLAIFGIIILFVLLICFGCKNGVQTEKTIRFPIISYSHNLVPEECTEDFLAVEIVFTPGNHKDGYSYSLSVFNNEFNRSTVKRSEAEYDPENGNCTATIFVPKAGESQFVAFVTNGRISGTNLLCWIEYSGGNAYRLRNLGEAYE